MVQKLELFPTSYEYSIGKYNNLKEMFVRGDVDISGNIVMSGNINCNEINSTSIRATTFYGDGSQLTGINRSGGSANLNEHTDVSFGNIDAIGNMNINGKVTITINDVDAQNITLLEMKTHSDTPRIKHDFWENSSGYGDYQIYPASAATTDFKIGGYSSTFQTIRLNALNGIEVYSNQSTNTYGNIKCNNIISNLVGDVSGTVSSLSNFNTDNLSQGSNNKYYSNSLVDSYLSGGTGITYNSGLISIGQAVGTASNVQFGGLNVSNLLNTMSLQCNTTRTNDPNGAALTVRGNYFQTAAEFQSTTNTAHYIQVFWNTVGHVGGIWTNGSSANFGLASDYRTKRTFCHLYKELNTLKMIPITYKSSRFEDGVVHIGFLAHEMQEVHDASVFGVKDALDANGNPKYQMVDLSKLVPIIAAAMKELNIIVDNQETIINNLKVENILLKSKLN